MAAGDFVELKEVDGMDDVKMGTCRDCGAEFEVSMRVGAPHPHPLEACLEVLHRRLYALRHELLDVEQAYERVRVRLLERAD